MRAAVQVVVQALIDLETSARRGRSPVRVTQRNGSRERLGETRVGAIPQRIPKLRAESYFPSLLEPRKRSEQTRRHYFSQESMRELTEPELARLVEPMPLTLAPVH